MKLNTKRLVPIFLALIFLGSVFAVFTQSSNSKETGNAELIVNFGLPTMTEGAEMRVLENMSALRFLSSYAVHVEVKAGDVYCISNYCNTNKSEWVFYVNNEVQENAAESYAVNSGDIIMFRYERLPEPVVELISEVEEVLTFDFLGNEVNVTGIELPLDEESACELYKQVSNSDCDDKEINELKDGSWEIVELCKTGWGWCIKGSEVSWTTINTTDMKISSIAIT